MARPVWTKPERRCEVTWSTITDTERTTLTSFWEEYSCTTFTWTDDGVAHNVMFDPAIDRLDASFQRVYDAGKPVWSVSITFLEV